MIDRKSFEPMYQQIKRDIEQQILSGQIKIGDKLMSETEMLEHYHVARMTVRAALTELVNNGCLAKERGRGTFCVALPRQAKKSIDVLLDTGDNYFAPYFLSGIGRVLDREGYQLVLNDTRDNVEMFEKLLQQIISRGTSGIIIQPYRRVQDISEELLQELESCQAAGIPVVTIDGKFRDQDLVGYMTDDVYGGRLPVHVRFLLDEMANIGQIPKFEKLIATIRSREISASIILQAQSQLKAIYKDNADTIIGNCDTTLFLGGKEKTTLKEISETLGKETIDMYNTSETRSNQKSYGLNYQKLGKELMTQDELSVMDGGKCILQLRGVRPFLSEKYDITAHPRYKYLSDADKKNEFDIERFLNRRPAVVKENEQFDLYNVDVPDEEKKTD